MSHPNVRQSFIVEQDNITRRSCVSRKAILTVRGTVLHSSAWIVHSGYWMIIGSGLWGKRYFLRHYHCCKLHAEPILLSSWLQILVRKLHFFTSRSCFQWKLNYPVSRKQWSWHTWKQMAETCPTTISQRYFQSLPKLAVSAPPHAGWRTRSRFYAWSGN
jgi:hypothetical protein